MEWVRTMNNKHNEFVESLRNIMREKEKKKTVPAKKRDEEYNEDTQSLQEVLEAKFDELFGPIDGDND